MPSREALKRVEAASERMKQAQQKHLDFMKQLGRSYSAEDRAENDCLLSALQNSITEFWEAFNQAESQDVHRK